MAQAGGPDVAKLDEALTASCEARVAIRRKGAPRNSLAMLGPRHV